MEFGYQGPKNNHLKADLRDSKTNNWDLKKYEGQPESDVSKNSEYNGEEDYEIKKGYDSDNDLALNNDNIIKNNEDKERKNNQENKEKNEKESQTSNSSSPPFSEESTNHYPYTINEIINNKYKVSKIIYNIHYIIIDSFSCVKWNFW